MKDSDFQFDYSRVKPVAQVLAEIFLGDKSKFYEIEKKESKNFEDFLLLTLNGFILNDVKKIRESIVELISFLNPSIREFLLLRWEACIFAFQGNFADAIEKLDVALVLAKQCEGGGWIVRDILVDLRNISLEKNFASGNAFEDSGKYQNELITMSNWYYMPGLDRQLLNGLEELQDELFSRYTDGPNTTRMGDNLNSMLVQFGEALCGALYFGSYTYLNVVRKRLAKALIFYARNRNSFDLLKECLRQFSFGEDIDEIKKILKFDREQIYKSIAGNPMPLIDFVVPVTNKESSFVIRSIFIAELGNYIPDQDIAGVEEFLYTCLDKQFSMISSKDNLRNALYAFSKIVDQVDVSKLILKMLELIKENILVNDVILEIFNIVDWKKVPKDMVTIVAARLGAEINSFHHTASVYKVLSNLRNICNIYSEKFELDLLNSSNYMNDLNIIFYFSNTKNSEYIEKKFEMEIKVIDYLNTSNVGMVKNGPIGFGGYSLPYLYYNFAQKNIVGDSEKVESTFKEILENSFQLDKNKYECVTSILFLYMNKYLSESNKLIWKNLSDWCLLNEKIIMECRSNVFFERSYKERIEIRLLTLSLEAGQERSHEEIVTKISRHLMNPLAEVRLEALQYINSTLNLANEESMDIYLEMVYMKTFDNWPEVREYAVRILSSKTVNVNHWEEISIGRLKELSRDNDDSVREIVLKEIVQRTSDSDRKGEYFPLLEWMKFDPHYAVRKLANETLAVPKLLNN